MNSMYDRVKAYIEKNCMLEGIGRVVVGLSGGADSVPYFPGSRPASK